MFKLHKSHLPGCIHSGHFMVSRLDDDEDNNDPEDDTSESERENANSVEIDVTNPDSVVDAKNLDINFVVQSPSSKEELTSWNDLDRPKRHTQKLHQYLTYYTNSHHQTDEHSRATGEGTSSSSQIVPTDASTHQRHLISLGQTRVGCDALDARHCNNKNSTTKDSKGCINLSYIQQQHQLQLQLQNRHNQPQAYNEDSTIVQKEHHQHAVTIDTSLTKLLECMSLYYSSNLTSPKWKSFKGLKLRLKYKIRLNNLIWRAWFLQCIRGRRPPGCQFNAPVETDVHKKSETIVLEGKYWKRKEKAIVDEYKKWRIFHKQKSQINCFRPVSIQIRASSLWSSVSSSREHETRALLRLNKQQPVSHTFWLKDSQS